MATWLAADELDFHGAPAVASGSIDRAQRLLEPLSHGPDRGWLAFHRGFIANIKGEIGAAEEDGTPQNGRFRRRRDHLRLPTVRT